MPNYNRRSFRPYRPYGSYKPHYVRRPRSITIVTKRYR